MREPLRRNAHFAPAIQRWTTTLRRGAAVVYTPPVMRPTLISLLLWLVACDGGAPAASPAQERPVESTRVARPRPTPSCRVVGTRTLAQTEERPRLVASALNEGGGLLLWVGASGETRALALGPRARGEVVPIELPRALGLLTFARVGAYYVALTEGACEAGSHCLRATAFDGAGARVDETSDVALPSAPLTLRRRVLGDRLLLALSTRHAAPKLYTFTASSDGLEASARPLALGPWPEEADATVLALTTEGSRWAALYRVGPTEAPTSHVVLALDDGPHEVPSLEHALAVDDLVFQGDGLVALVSYEFFRPKLHRLHLDGSAHVEARELLPGVALPRAFAGRRRASLEHGGALEFLLHSPAGDRLGSPLPLAANGRAPADVSHVGDDYVVTLWRERRLEAVRVACDGEAAP